MSSKYRKCCFIKHTKSGFRPLFALVLVAVSWLWQKYNFYFLTNPELCLPEMGPLPPFCACTQQQLQKHWVRLNDFTTAMPSYAPDKWNKTLVWPDLAKLFHFCEFKKSLAIFECSFSIWWNFELSVTNFTLLVKFSVLQMAKYGANHHSRRK